MLSLLSRALFVAIALVLFAVGGTCERPPHKVFGLGLSKTATTSLSVAFEMLGYKTIHNDRSLAPFLFNRTTINLTGRYDDVDAVFDLPTAFYPEALLSAYPNALFILTERNVDDWYRSFVAHDKRTRALWGGLLPRRVQVLHHLVYGDHTPNKELWKSAFTSHSLRVRRTIPTEQLLVLDMFGDGNGTTNNNKEQGWAFQRICAFLNKTDGKICGLNPSDGSGMGFPFVNARDRSAYHQDPPLSFGCGLVKMDHTHADVVLEAREAATSATATTPTVNAHSRYAYVTLVASRNRDYLISALVLAKSIRDSGSQQDIILMLHGSPSVKDRKLLHAAAHSIGFKLMELHSHFAGSIKDSTLPRWRKEGLKEIYASRSYDEEVVQIYMQKFQSLQLTEYSKIIFLDSDVIVLQNLDAFFGSNSAAKPFHGPSVFRAEAGGRSPINAGFFVTDPDCQAYVDLKDMAHSIGAFHPLAGWFDYGPIPPVEGIGHFNWSFYAAEADQGLLFFYYKLLLDKAKILPPRSLNTKSFVHFMGLRKPWLEKTREMPPPNRITEAAVELWHNTLNKIMDALSPTPFFPALSHSAITQHQKMEAPHIEARQQEENENVLQLSKQLPGNNAVGFGLSLSGSRDIYRRGQLPPRDPYDEDDGDDDAKTLAIALGVGLGGGLLLLAVLGGLGAGAALFLFVRYKRSGRVWWRDSL